MIIRIDKNNCRNSKQRVKLETISQIQLIFSVFRLKSILVA